MKPVPVIHIETIKGAYEILQYFNSLDLDNLELHRNEQRIDIDPEIIKEWKYIGLNNTDFVIDKFYKKEDKKDD